MNTLNLPNNLQELGFSQKEAEVYIQILKHPNLSATSIAKFVTYDRRVVYDIISNLFQKGYISQFSEKNTKKYQVVNPSILIQELDEKHKIAQKAIEQIKQISPQTQTDISILKGKNGLISVFEEIIEKKCKHYAFGDISKALDKKDQLVLHYLEEYEKLNLEEEIIFEEGFNFKALKNGKYKYLKKELIPPICTIIYEDIVILMLNDEQNSILKIQNSIVADSYLAHFRVYWNLGTNI